MNAADVMVRDVITVRSDASIHEVAALLIARRITAVPVTNANGKLLGIISEGDLLRRSETETERRRPWWLKLVVSNDTLSGEFIKSHSRRVSDVMTPDVIVASPDTPLHEIATLLERNRIKRIPIVQNDRIVGLVSRADLVRALVSSHDHGPLRTAPDDVALRNTLITKLEAESWAPSQFVNVAANSGQIDVWGFVDSDSQREAIRVAIETTPGVTAVNNKLIIRPVMVEG